MAIHVKCANAAGGGWLTLELAPAEPYFLHDYIGDTVTVCAYDPSVSILKPLSSDNDPNNWVQHAVVNVNADDDDGDGGAHRHGRVDYVADKDDDLVMWDDDLLKLRVDLTGAPSGVVKFEYPSDRLSLWASANKGSRITAGQPIATNGGAFHVWVEGLSPSVDRDADGMIDPDTITIQFCQGGREVLARHVTVTVAEPMFAIMAYGSTSESVLREWLTGTEGNPGVAIDARTDPFFIEAANGRTYSLYIWDTEKECKIALQTPNAIVLVDGHSNWGVGYAFGERTTIEDLNDFMNVGEGLVSIDLYRMRNEGNWAYSGLTVNDSMRGGSAPNYRVWQHWANYRPDLPNVYATRYSATDPGNVPGREQHDWTPWNSSDPKVTGYHYTMPITELTGSPASPQEITEHRMVVKGGAADKPTLRYKTLFLNSCSSGPYFYSQFTPQAGQTLFYSTKDVYSPFADDATTLFFSGIVNGAATNTILASMNQPTEWFPWRGFRDPYDYKTVEA